VSKKLFSANPARIGGFDGSPTSDAIPASLVDGTPSDLKADLIALLADEVEIPIGTIRCGTAGDRGLLHPERVVSAKRKATSRRTEPVRWAFDTRPDGRMSRFFT
jgi:hypothetical protein